MSREPDAATPLSKAALDTEPGVKHRPNVAQSGYTERWNRPALDRDDIRRVHDLQRLLLRSWSARCLAVRRVTQDNAYASHP